MVYNGVSIWMNTDLWGTHFALPAIRYVLMEMERVTYMVDW